MLYKTLISMYGSSLAGKSAPQDDIVWHLAPSEYLRGFRVYALDALQQAKVYLLDHLAAAYADTLHEALSDDVNDPAVPALAILGEVKLPSKIAWVEFDDRALGEARFQRTSPVTRFYDKPLGTGLRGFLIDDRNERYLRVTMFHKREGKGAIDPICTLLFERTVSGTLNYDDIQVELSRSMVEFYVRNGSSKEAIDGMRTVHQVETGYDLFIPYLLFAMLISPDLGGIIPMDLETYTAKERKTARKFGKSWLLGAQKSHLTIRIGPQAAAHMAERAARLEFQRQALETRSGPVRHWVVAHERRYRSGKIVLVKGHHRGNAEATQLPTRVMGPRLDAIRFQIADEEAQNRG